MASAAATRLAFTRRLARPRRARPTRGTDRPTRHRPDRDRDRDAEATHLAVAQAALQAGKHVVVDKPFTLTLLEAQRLDALVTAKERALSVFHNRRWDGDFITVQRLIASGELNRVTHFESHFDRIRPLVRARWRESAESVAGLWFDLGPHLLHQALPLFGWPQALFLDAATLRDGALSDDWCVATLHCDRLRVTLHASMLQAACDLRYAVHGTRGSYLKLTLTGRKTH